jgi:hypothetical protein
MAESARAASGRIFLSYRREETAYAAGWLYDRLAECFGDGQVFKDVDSIELGDDFVEAIVTAVGSCDVLLALIGDRWVTITSADGRRRLEDPEDFVRLEIESALTRDVRVVPILVAGATMPSAGDLPPSLARLVRRQALELSPSRFDDDLGRLLRVLDSTLAEAHEEAAQPAEGWFRHEAGSQRPRTRPQTAERHSDGESLSPAARRDTTGYDGAPRAPAAPPSASWPAGPRGTVGGAGPPSATTLPAEMRAVTQVTWYSRLISYGRFWFGLLFILAGLIPFVANVPHYYGYEKYPKVPHLHVYIELGLGALLLVGVLLLVSALISARQEPGSPRDPGR